MNQAKQGCQKMPLRDLGGRACNTTPPGKGPNLHLKLFEIKSESERDCEDDELIGIVALADKLRNICFVQGIS
jgi:hypothetical protein